MNDTVSIPREFQKLLATSKKSPKRRNKQNRRLQIQHENELLQLLHSKWSILMSGAPFIQMDNQEIKSLTKQMYADSSSLLAYFHKNRLLIKIIEYGNNSLNWNVALPSPVYLMPNSKPLLNEYDFIELYTFRSLESKFELSLEMLDELSFDERAGQLLFSAIAYGALFVPWKQRALMNSVADQWVFESFASWVELKELKNSSKRKLINELCDDDYQKARWFPDPLSELIIIRWLRDYPDTECFKGNRGIQSLLFAFLRKAGVPEDEMPPSLSAFTQWASHPLALELPPIHAQHLIR